MRACLGRRRHSRKRKETQRALSTGGPLLPLTGWGLQGRLSRVKVGGEHRKLRLSQLWSPLRSLRVRDVTRLAAAGVSEANGQAWQYPRAGGRPWTG